MPLSSTPIPRASVCASHSCGGAGSITGGAGGDVEDKKEDTEKAQLARTAADEALKKAEEERRNIRIQPGDYQVQVPYSNQCMQSILGTGTLTDVTLALRIHALCVFWS